MAFDAELIAITVKEKYNRIIWKGIKGQECFTLKALIWEPFSFISTVIQKHVYLGSYTETCLKGVHFQAALFMSQTDTSVDHLYEKNTSNCQWEPMEGEKIIESLGTIS